jgi:hypothetical protein
VPATLEMQNFLQGLAAAYREGQWPTLEGLRQLMAVWRGGPRALREQALTLLLVPPLTCGGVYLCWLCTSLRILFPRARDLPLPFMELFLDVLEFLEEAPDSAETGRDFRSVVANLSLGGLQLLSHKPLLLNFFLRHLPVRRLVWLGRGGPPRGRRRALPGDLARRWRLLRKRLLALPAESSWSRLTTRDLRPLWQLGRARQQKLLRFGRYRQVACQLVAPLAQMESGEGAARFATKPHNLYWNGMGPRTLAFWSALIRQQGEELLEVRRLARLISEAAGRVVLSWHNATLAAASGWAFEGLAQQLADQHLWQFVQQGVHRHAQEMLADIRADRHNGDSTQRLWELWERRLILPKIKHALWESRFRAFLDPSLEAAWQEDARRAGVLLDAASLQEISQGQRHGWCGALSPHQGLRLADVMKWRAERQVCWQPGLVRLAALIRTGDELLAAGRLQHLVLPWIDKFFISSQRAEDLQYLPLLIDWLTRQGCRPLILFWEDTSHRQNPSFQLALQRLRAQGQAFAGIGIFSDQPQAVPREEAQAFILRHHRDCQLFALRPYRDQYQPADLRGLLENTDYRFLQPHNYDSAWKDNLCFLYAGTQVFPLLAVQTDAELFPAWVGFNRVRYPFGTCLRSCLRQQVTGVTEALAAESGLSLEYARWANLH